MILHRVSESARGERHEAEKIHLFAGELFRRPTPIAPLALPQNEMQPLISAVPKQTQRLMSPLHRSAPEKLMVISFSTNSEILPQG
jgi:hypothetical protein